LRRRGLALLLVGAATVLPLAPASAKCADDHPCSTACDKVVADRYDSVTRMFGIPLPGFPVTCPRT
jgi:hypothetical protein